MRVSEVSWARIWINIFLVQTGKILIRLGLSRGYLLLAG